MKCPHCHHKTDKSQVMKCSHCGQVYERGYFEEYQYLEFLHSWLQDHEAKLGNHARILLGEVENRQAEVNQLLGIYLRPVEEVVHERSLVLGTLACVRAWCKAVRLSDDATERIIVNLKKQSSLLHAELGDRSIKLEEPKTLEIFDFALVSIPRWEEEGCITYIEARLLVNQLRGQRRAHLAILSKQIAWRRGVLYQIPIWVRKKAMSPTFAEGVETHLTKQVKIIETELGGYKVETATPEEMVQFALQALPEWAESPEILCQQGEIGSLRDYLLSRLELIEKPKVAAEAAVAVSKSTLKPAPIKATPKPKPRPTAPPKPEKPPFDWGKVWDKIVQAAVSGALLRGVLYLGAFMIVVSLTILVVLFWEIFPTAVQAVFVFSVPTVFYLAGWLVSSKLKLPQAGGVLTGIGALLIAVDLAAIYQFGGLAVDLYLYWLFTSLICTLAYALTAWRSPGIFFDYITLVAGGSTVLALTFLAQLPMPWRIPALTAYGVLMIIAAARLSIANEKWHQSGRANRYLSQVLIPACLVLALVVPERSAFALSATFWLAAIGYGLLAWRFPTKIYPHAGVWSSIGACAFTLWALGLPLEWFAVTGVVIAAAYSLLGRFINRLLSQDFALRTSYTIAFNIAGSALIILATLGGLLTLPFELWAGISALCISSLVLGLWAYIFHRPFLVAIAGGLFVVPVSLAVGRVLLDAHITQWGAWLVAVWTGLALVYLVVAILLRSAEKYAVWLMVWGQLLIPAAATGLVVNYLFSIDTWINIPTLFALGGMILFYLTSAILHDRDRYPVLSESIGNLLPKTTRQSIFLWPIGLLLPVWIAIAWVGTPFVFEWLGVALSGLGLAYIGIGQGLSRHKLAYRLPMHIYAYALGLAGVVVSFNQVYPLLSALYLDMLSLALLAVIYRRVQEIILATVLFIWPFQLTLQVSPLNPDTYTLAYALLASVVYIPIGLLLSRYRFLFALPLYIVGYLLSVLAVAAPLAGIFGFYISVSIWVSLAVTLIVTTLYIFSTYRFREEAFAWASALTAALAYWHLLRLLEVPFAYYAACWVGLAFVYLLMERSLARLKVDWVTAFRYPLDAGVITLGVLGLSLTVYPTIEAFSGIPLSNYLPVILAQAIAVVLVFVAAALHQSRWPLYLEPLLAVFAVTLFFIGYSEMLFGKELIPPQHAIIWSGLAVLHVALAVTLDNSRERYSHGIYLGGYALGLFAVAWSLFTQDVLLWTLGLWIGMAAGSALLVHFNRHHSWNDLITAIFGSREGVLRELLKGIFIWVSAWSTPIWCVLFLYQVNILNGYQWLGFSIPALAYIGLALWLGRVERTYRWAFQTAGQFYVFASLLISAPFTFSFLTGTTIYMGGAEDINAIISVQALAVVYYALFAGAFHKPIYTHLAAWLSFFPYTLAWIAYSSLSTVQFALPWIGWAGVLLILGFILDPRRLRYAHGPYLAGYLLAVFALFWSVPDRLTTLYVLGGTVILGLLSQLVVHTGRHRSFNDFIASVWRKPSSIAYRAACTSFLFFAVYAFPVWLVLLLSYQQVPWAWRGLALALVAPVYIAIGIAVNKVKNEYTWPMYSAGYTLTAIGAMVAIEDLELAIYVLALNTVVYAVSAYIFRKPFWLFLSNTLVPVVLILTLNYNQILTPAWVSQTLMALAFLYFALGLWLDGRLRTLRPTGNVASFALPFYTLGYLISAVSMATASGELYLAIGIYSASVILYALSAWAFRETIFLYPAAWLAGIPYYLVMTQLITQGRWYGLGWLPLILTYVLIGRFAFQEKLRLRPLRFALTNPSMPFYLLAYALSISMIALSAVDSLILTLALGAAAGIYLFSTLLFRHAAWLYPSLLAVHLGLLSYFTIQPSGKPASYISLPFLGLTWILALIGYAVSLRSPVPRNTMVEKLFSRFGERRFKVQYVPSVGHLLTFTWAQPLFLFVTLDILLWGGIALFGTDTAIIVSVGYAVLLGLFAMLWIDSALAYGSLACALLAVCARLLGAELPFPILMAWIGGIGLGTYLLGLFIEQIIEGLKPKSSHLEVWPKPLRNVSLTLSTLAVLGTPPFAVSYTTACAAALAFAGALYLAFAYQGRRYWLGYLGTGMLLMAWIMVLVVQDVRQPQLYAIPFGLYLAGIGYLERRQGRVMFGSIVECTGFCVMLLTSFIQSLGGAAGFPYFLLLMGESLAIFWWGAAQHCKIPLFIGIGGSVINIVAQIIVLVNVYQVSRWFVTLGVGLVLVVMGVFVERKREHILSQAKEWREAIEAWD